MTVRAWRIIKEKYAGSAFTGEGASLAGGRWNSPGVWVVYVSSTKSLAALEMLVHLNPPVTLLYVAIPVEFDDAVVETVGMDLWPPNWQEEPPPQSTKQIGDVWVKAARSAVLKVPSVIVPDEANYVLNPNHPEFAKLRIGSPVPFAFDQRLLV